jgi:TonB family protein
LGRSGLSLLERASVITVCGALYLCQSRSAQIHVPGFEFLTAYSGTFLRSRYPVNSNIRWLEDTGATPNTSSHALSTLSIPAKEPPKANTPAFRPQEIVPTISRKNTGLYSETEYLAARRGQSPRFTKPSTSLQPPKDQRPPDKHLDRTPAQATRGYASTPPRSSTASAPGHFRVGGGTTAPVLLYKVEPEYSEEARAAKYQGTVLLRVVITPEGAAGEIKVIRLLGRGLDEKAIEAVKQWRFRPGLRDGRPVHVGATIEVNFKLM